MNVSGRFHVITRFRLLSEQNSQELYFLKNYDIKEIREYRNLRFKRISMKIKWTKGYRKKKKKKFMPSV